MSVTVTGFGAAPNCHFRLLNVHEGRASYDGMGVDRYSSPGAGASTPWHNRTSTAAQNIEAGSELFVDYGPSEWTSEQFCERDREQSRARGWGEREGVVRRYRGALFQRCACAPAAASRPRGHECCNEARARFMRKAHVPSIVCSVTLWNLIINARSSERGVSGKRIGPLCRSSPRVRHTSCWCLRNIASDLDSELSRCLFLAFYHVAENTFTWKQPT